MRQTNEQQAPTILRDVSRSLKQLINQNITELKEQDIVFDLPGNEKGGSQTGLFLYMLELQPIVNQDSNRLVLKQQQLREAPLPVELTYMVTPFAQNRETELILLEKLIRLFYDNGILEKEQLVGSVGFWQDKLKINRKRLKLEEVQQIWSMFSNKNFRTSLFYTVGTVYIQSARVEGYAPVERIQTTTTRMEESFTPFEKGGT